MRNSEWPAVLDEVTGALETLTTALDSVDDFTVLLHQVCEHVTRAVPGVDEATITLLTDGTPVTAATTNDVVAALDHDQYTIGDGPCLRAAQTGKLVRVSITEAAELWPTFAKDSAAAGFGSFLSAPLAVTSGQSGAVTATAPATMASPNWMRTARPLHHSRHVDPARLQPSPARATTTDQLREALTRRSVIDQAKGILMALRQISADDAFTLLVEQSQRENVKVRDLAIRFITHTTGMTPTT